MMRNAMGPLSWSRRQTGRSPRARTSSISPRSTSFFTTFCAAAPFRRGGSITQRSARRAAPDRTIFWVSVSFVADICGILRVCGTAATTAAPLRRQRRRGRIPEKPSPRTTKITAPFAAECQSFLRLFLMPFCVHRIRKCRPTQAQHAVHNGLVGGASPPSPTTHSHANRDFPRFDEYPRFRGGAGPTCSLCREEGPLQRQFGAFCLRRPKTVSRGACEGAAGDAVRMRLRPGLRPASSPA
jgi:hypothetical protein